MISSRRSTSSPWHPDAAVVWGLRGLASVGGVVSVLIVVFLVLEAVPTLARYGVGAFVGSGAWQPSRGLFDLTPMMWGTILVSGGAVALAGPLGLGSALFVNLYAPRRVGALVRTMLEVLAGVPSVVYGFWGLMVVVPWIGSMRPPGASLLAGVLVLTLMVTPTMAVLVDAALASVPREQLHAALALGLSRAATVRAVIWPNIRSGVWTGLILTLGRALGETMAVLMVCGNVIQVPGSPFDPVRTLTANMALEMAYAMGDHRGALFVTGLCLMVLVAVLVLAADGLARRGRHA